MPRMTDDWYQEQAQRNEYTDVVVDKTTVDVGDGPDARPEQGAWVCFWVPDPPLEQDPLEERKRAIE